MARMVEIMLFVQLKKCNKMSLKKCINRKTLHFNQYFICKYKDGKPFVYRKEGYCTFGGKLSYNFSISYY